MAQSIYKFDMPDSHKSIIKVIGVGGGGSNAVTYMYRQGIKDVEFLVCNTDSQHLKSCGVPQKLQIGVNITKGLGAGARPERGRESALENKEEIREMLSQNTRMVFITAGMGGGTGTGAAPVVARIARELDILTIGIVTLPFKWEGGGKKRQAMEGINEMKAACDTVIIINNDKLQELFGKLEIGESFSKANDVLLTAAKSIAEVITVQSEINVDFADVERVMKNSGAAVMGSALGKGEGRALKAIEQALYSPLIDGGDVFGAKNILLSITYGPEAKFTMDELTDITDYITEKVGAEADVIPGLGQDEELGDAIRVTVIATGFDENEKSSSPKDVKKVIDLESNRQINMFDTSNEVKKTESIYSFERPQPKQETKDESKEDEPVVKNLFTEEIVFKKAEPVKEESVESREFFFDLTKEKKVLDWEVKEVKQEPKVEEKKQLQVTDDDKEKLSKSFADRIKRLSSLTTSQNLDPDEFKEKLEVPAYLRKKVDLKEQPHSSERNVSKFTLNEDNDLLGNNKFLHDNVD